MDSKKWWLSKTLRVNLLAIIVLLVQAQTGYVIAPEAQASILGVINIILRAITKTAVEWK